MHPTRYPHVNKLLADLLAGMRGILGDRLVGLYLHGSVVTGDYDAHSDVDLLAALADDLTDADFAALDALHQTMVANDAQWDNHIEIAYLSLHGLKTFRTERSQIGIISPGEPFHFLSAGIDWLMNWYMVRERGLTLYGPPPQAIIDPIPTAEFVQAVKDHIVTAPNWIKNGADLPWQSYTILTSCRALYTVNHGEQVSKAKAAEWVQQQLPEWADTIKDALIWRQGVRDLKIDPAETLPNTLLFVNIIVERIRGMSVR
jgi:hypothetical protein